MKKLLTFIATAMLSATTLMAQSDKKFNLGAEVGIGSEVEAGVRAEYGLNEYLSWDALHLKYAYDYGKNDKFHELSLTTGVRGYSPSFGPNLQVFAAIDLGYGVLFYGGDNVSDSNTSCFAMDFTAGVRVSKNMYLGYGLGLMHHSGNHKDHLLRIGFNF